MSIKIYNLRKSCNGDGEEFFKIIGDSDFMVPCHGLRTIEQGVLVYSRLYRHIDFVSLSKSHIRCRCGNRYDLKNNNASMILAYDLFPNLGIYLLIVEKD